MSGLLAGVHSLLFVPADRPDRMEKAWASPAHAVIADLEDAVGPGEKAAARTALAQRLERPRERGRVVVRVNALDTEHAAADLALVAAAPQVDAIVVPKAEPATLARATFPTPVIALVESAHGLRGAYEIAGAETVEALMLGPVDLAAELGLRVGADGRELLFARSQLVVDSAAAGLGPPIDGPSLAIGDEARLRAETEAGRALGFGSKTCIHPSQLAPVHAVFAPTDEELTWAERVLDGARAARGGVFELDGEMVDEPVVKRARRILEAAAA